MKTTGFLCCLFACLQIGAQGQTRVIEQPAFDTWNSTTLEIDRIELSDTATVFYVDAFFRPHYWIQIVKETTLQADGKSYPIRSAEGITLSEKFWMPDSGTASFRLFFPPLPKGTRQVDFIEGNEERAFRIWGIRLDGTKPEAQPSQYVFNPDLKLEEPKLERGTGTLEGELIGYKEGMSKSLQLILFNMLTGNSEEHYVDILSNGTFRFESPLIALTSVVLIGDGITHRQFYMKPGETTRLKVNLSEICRSQSKKRQAEQSLGDKYYFSGALADLNNELGNSEQQEPFFGANSQEAYMQQIKEIGAMTTLDQYKSYWTAKYEKAAKELEQMTGISNARRTLIDQRLKHELARELMTYGIIDYYYRQANNIPRDSVLADRPELIPQQSYFDFLPKCIPNDGYFFYDGSFAYMLAQLRYTNFSGKKLERKQGEPLPDNTADLTRIMGYNAGPLFDLLTAYRYASSIAEFQPLTADDKSKLDALNPALKTELLAMNERLLQTIEENKKKSGYTVDRVNIAEIPEEELFNAIITPYRGKVIFVDFWATWCGPCKAAMKMTEPVKKEYADKEVVFLYLAGENSPKGAWEQMIPDIKGEHYRMSEKQWAYMGKKFGVQGVPSYMVIARDGTPTHFQVGFPGVETMKKWLNEELAK